MIQTSDICTQCVRRFQYLVFEYYLKKTIFCVTTKHKTCFEYGRYTFDIPIIMYFKLHMKSANVSSSSDLVQLWAKARCDN